MKLTVPDELKNSFDMLMKSLPAILQQNDDVKDTALVYLKLGGMNLARNYLETTKKYLENDPLETGQGLRFPKIVDPKSDEGDADETQTGDDDNDDDVDDDVDVDVDDNGAGDDDDLLDDDD